MEMFLPFESQTDETPKNLETNANELKLYVGKFSHAPQVWEFFIKDEKLFLKQDGKEFELKKTGKDTFAFDEGEFLFVRNDAGEIEHIFTGLYAARKIS